MTPEELKQLAEFAPEFLKKAINNNSLPMPSKRLQRLIFERPVHPDEWFGYQETAPILTHLGKREMEKREFEWELATIWIKPGIRGYQCEVYGFEKNSYSTEVVCSHENEYIAFWSAVMEAVKDGS